MGSYLSVHNDTNKTVYVNLGPDFEAMKISGWILGSVGLLSFAHWGATAQKVGSTPAMWVANACKASGMVELAPGQTHTWGKMSLSLWQQANVIFAHQNPDNPKEHIVERTVMRPIFSGATDGSTNTHSVQWWINKWGTDRKTFEVE